MSRAAAPSCSAAASPARRSPAASAAPARRSSTPRTSCSTRRCCPRRRRARSSPATSSCRCARCARTPTCCSAGRPRSTRSARTVSVESEAGRFIVSYTDLVVALGSVTRMPAVPGLAEHALGLKDLGDAIRLRNHVLRQIELADAGARAGGRAADVRVRRRGLRGRRGDRRAARDGRGRAAPPPAPARRRAALDPRRPVAAHPRPDAGVARRLRHPHARPQGDRGPQRHGAAVGRRRRRHARRRPPHPDPHRRVDRGRRRPTRWSRSSGCRPTTAAA